MPKFPGTGACMIEEKVTDYIPQLPLKGVSGKSMSNCPIPTRTSRRASVSSTASFTPILMSCELKPGGYRNMDSHKME